MSEDRELEELRRVPEEIPLPGGSVGELLGLAHRAGVRTQSRVWWVGGGPRDILRAVGSADLDFAIGGELDAFVATLAELSGAEVVSRSRFDTVELRREGVRIDLARTRGESYSHPAALPAVREGSILEDLARRDFTVNAMAIPVAPDLGGELLDPHQGRRDLRSGFLRVLHPRSFEDDPTRVLRAVEFTARFDFRLDPESESAARAEIQNGGLIRLTGKRLGTALERVLCRPAVMLKALDVAESLGVIRAIDPALRWSQPQRLALADASSILAEWRCPEADESSSFLLALLALLPEDQEEVADRLARRLELPASRSSLLDKRLLFAISKQDWRVERPPSTVHRQLAPLHPVQLAWLAGSLPICKAWVRREMETMRPVRLSISGADLVRSGVVPGPKIGELLALTEAARLDGKIGRGEELEFALAAAGSKARRR